MRDNVAYGRPDASDGEIEAAARSAGVWSALAGLPGGLSCSVGERGRGLSAGQRQLVALARVELARPDVLLLDEATANLDPATEHLVLTATARLSARRTTVRITHRLTAAAEADRIVVLAAGRLVEQGRHDELLAAGGEYARMWEASTGGPSATLRPSAGREVRTANG